MAATYDQQRTL